MKETLDAGKATFAFTMPNYIRKIKGLINFGTVIVVVVVVVKYNLSLYKMNKGTNLSECC